MQWIIKKVGCMLQSLIGTTLVESVTVAANIVLGMTESPLIVKPYLRVIYGFYTIFYAKQQKIILTQF